MQAIACAHAAPPVPAAGDDVEFSIRDNWPEKFTDTLHYRRVSVATRPDGRKVEREYLATIDVAIRERRGDVTLISWTYTHMTLNGKPQADLALDLSVTPEGVVELLNIDDVQQKLLVQAAKPKPKSDDPWDMNGDERVNLARNRDAIANFYARDPNLFFYPLDTEVHRDHAVEYDTQIAGLGDDTLAAVDRWTMLPGQDVPSGTFAVEWTQEMDCRDFKRYSTQVLADIGKEIEVSKGVLARSGVYALDHKTFWPHVARISTQTSVQPGQLHVETIDMRSTLLDAGWKHWRTDESPSPERQ